MKATVAAPITIPPIVPRPPVTGVPPINIAAKTGRRKPSPTVEK
jgi:hypothetical protein